jgi:tetratricopeptide (TPR) repeat protein
MSERFRFSLPDRPTGTPVSRDEAERILRANVAMETKGSQEHRDALWDLMRFLSMTERQADGISILDQMLATTSDPEQRAEIVLATGQLMEMLEDFPNARVAYTQGVALEPVGGRTWYLLHNNLGYCLNQLDRFDEAERWCRSAIEIDSLRHNAYKNLGIAYQGQGKFADAARAFIQAIHCEASDPRALLHLEDLIEKHPEIANEIPDLADQARNCRTAVETAKKTVEDWMSGQLPEPEE